MTTSSTITGYYQNILQRDPTSSELSSKVSAVDGGSQTLNQIRDELINSMEAQQYVFPVARIYQAVFGREPDSAGFDVNVDALRGDLELVQLANAFVGSQEFLDRFGTRDVTDAYIEALYQNVLGRASDAAGKAGWLASGQSAAEILIGFSESAEFQNNYNPSVVNFLQASASGSKDDPGTDLGFMDDDGKVGIDMVELYTEFENLLNRETAQSSDIISLNAFRADSRFSGIDGSGQTVVVIDTGIDLNHPAFGPDSNGDGVSDRIVYHEDFSRDGDGTADDVQGHGSNVASIVASSASGYQGVAPGANIIALQALGNNGSGRNGDIEKALQWVVANASTYNITAVNMSLGNGTNVNAEGANPSGYADELTALNNLGVITIAAAGNDYFSYQTEGASDLAADPNTIAVGAVWDANVGKVTFRSGAEDTTTGADRLTSFSQRSDDLPTIFAPGAFITGAAPGGGTSSQGGTSQAAPHIAGIAALAQQLAQQTIGRRLTPAEFESLLFQTGDTIFDGDDENDNVANTNVNYTRVDVLALGNQILTLGGGATPSPTPTDTIPGDTSSTTSLTIGTDFTSNIDYRYDSDWIRVSLNGGQSYTFDVLGLPSLAGTLGDPTVTLRDSNGNSLAFNDDGGNSLESRLTYTPSATGTYFVEVKAYSTQTGSYVVRTSTSGAVTEIPGDSSTTATVSAGQTLTGTLDFSRDTDWYSISLTAGTTYQIDLKGAPSGSGTIADPLVRIFNSSGTQVDSNDDGGTGLESLLQYTASSTGTYYIEAGSFRTTDLGTYSLSVAATGTNSGDIAGDSSTTSTIAAGGSVTSDLNPAGDTDWFRFDVTAGSEYRIDLVGVGSGELSDPLVRVVDASGSELARDDDGGTGLDSQLVYQATSTQTVYISAEAYANLYSGDYQLSVTQTRMGSSDIPGDTSTTSSLTVGTPTTSDLGFTGDEDWFSLSVTGGTAYTISLEGVGANELSDPYLRIYDSSGTTQLTFNDDGGTGLDSLLTYTPSSSGTVYVVADSFADRYTGDYQLLVTTAGSSSGDLPGDTSTTGTIAVGGSVTGALQVAGDTDWYRLELSSARTLQISLNGTGSDELRDPIVRLFNSAGTQLASDDDSGPGLDSLLTYSASAGTYYVGVDEFGSNGTGDYILSVA